MQLEHPPTAQQLQHMIGDARLSAWNAAASLVQSLYRVQAVWNDGGKKWRYEYKFRRGSKTLCALYAREQCAGFMIIFGTAERARFDALRDSLSAAALSAYDGAKTYADGKWVMFDPVALTRRELMQLLACKRTPDLLSAQKDDQKNPTIIDKRNDTTHEN